jgi:hypothetical protein
MPPAVVTGEEKIFVEVVASPVQSGKQVILRLPIIKLSLFLEN